MGCAVESPTSVSQSPASDTKQDEAVNSTVAPQPTNLLETTYKIDTVDEEVEVNGLVSYEELVPEKAESNKSKLTIQESKGASEGASIVVQAIDNKTVYYDERELKGDKIYSTAVSSYSLDTGEQVKVREFKDKDFIVSKIFNLGGQQAVVGYRTDKDGNQELTMQSLQTMKESPIVIGDEKVKELVSYHITDTFAIFKVKTQKDGEALDHLRTRLIQYDINKQEFSFIEKPADMPESLYYDQDATTYAVSDDNKTVAIMVAQTDRSYLFVKEFDKTHWVEYVVEGEAKLTEIFYGSRIIYEVALKEKEEPGSNYMLINIQTGNKRKVDNVGDLNLSSSQRIQSSAYATFGLNQLTVQKYGEEGVINSRLEVDGGLTSQEYSVSQILIDETDDSFYIIASPAVKQKGDLAQQKIYHVLEKTDETNEKDE